MRGRYRKKSRPEAQAEIRFKQDRFDGGLNNDVPASKIQANELALLENFVAYPDYLEGRSGSQKYSDTALPGSGTIRGYIFHPSAKIHVLHRGTGLWTAAVGMGSWTQVTKENNGYEDYVVNPSVTISGDAAGQLSVATFSLWGLNTSNSNAGVLYWGLTNSGSTRTLSIYKDSAGSNLVARGTRTGDGYINCTQQNGSGLGFSISVTYTTDDVTISANTINSLTLPSGSLVPDSYSAKMIIYKEDVVMFSVDNGILYIDISRNKIFTLNTMADGGDNVILPITDSGTQGSGTPYGRRYIYTLSRITDSSGVPDFTKTRLTGTLALETKATPIWKNTSVTNTNRDYGEHWVASPISSSATHSVDLTGGGDVDYGLMQYVPITKYAKAAYTHISVYGTLDIGVNGIDPITGAGNNREIYVWLYDVAMTSSSFTDSKSDDELRAALLGGFGLQTRFWTELPSSDTGDINNGFIYAAVRDGIKVYYGQLPKPEYIGYYHSAFQFYTFDDGVKEVRRFSDAFVIICSRSTYVSYPNINQQVSGVESIFVVKSFQLVSYSIGIVDYTSIAEIDNASFIAHCSDHSIRIFENGIWGATDFSDLRVGSLIKKIHTGSVAGYFAGVYLLWYRATTSESTVTTTCLRLGLKRESGSGWSKVTGSSWVFPALFAGVQTINDTNSVQRLLVLDQAGSAFYWVETFDGFTGSSLTKYFKDKVAVAGTGGTAITPKLRLREVTAEEESHTLYHEETHIYTRPSATSYESGFALDVNAYVDGSSTILDLADDANIPSGGSYGPGDIQFFERIPGKRIQLEFTFATSGLRITGIDSHYQSHDVSEIGAGPAESLEASYQADLSGSSNIKHWLTRPRNLLNRATGTNYTLAGTAPTNTTGPDGKSYGLSFVSGASYSQADTTSYSDFTIMFWIKSITIVNGRVVFLDGTNDFYVTFISNTEIDINGNSEPGNISSIASGWHHFAIVRSGSTVSVYQNGVADAAYTVATARGGTTTSFNSGGSACQLYDIRVFNDAISAGAVDYYYDSVNTTNTGKKVLPIV